MPGDGDPRGYGLRQAEAFRVRSNGRGRVEDGELEHLGLVCSDPVRVAVAEVVVGEHARPALRVVDDGDLEERPVGNQRLGELSDEGDGLDDLRRDATAVVANDERVAEVELEKMGGIDAVVDARDHEQAQPRESDRGFVSAGGGEPAVAGKRIVEARCVCGCGVCHGPRR